MSGTAFGGACGAIGAGDSMTWLQAVAACFVLGVLVSALYALVLWLAAHAGIHGDGRRALVGSPYPPRTQGSSQLGRLGPARAALSSSASRSSSRIPRTQSGCVRISQLPAPAVVSAAAPADRASAATPTVSSTAPSHNGFHDGAAADVRPQWRMNWSAAIPARPSTQISAIPTGRISTAPQTPAPHAAPWS
jgi:hypothetical protein